MNEFEANLKARVERFLDSDLFGPPFDALSDEEAEAQDTATRASVVRKLAADIWAVNADATLGMFADDAETLADALAAMGWRKGRDE